MFKFCCDSNSSFHVIASILYISIINSMYIFITKLKPMKKIKQRLKQVIIPDIVVRFPFASRETYRGKNKPWNFSKLISILQSALSNCNFIINERRVIARWNKVSFPHVDLQDLLQGVKTCCDVLTTKNSFATVTLSQIYTFISCWGG
jgi:hypothetical protein